MPFGLAEGLQWKSLSMGVITIIACFLLIKINPFSKFGDKYFRCLSRLGDLFGFRTQDIYQESVKFDLLRLALGLLVLYHYLPLFLYSVNSNNTEALAAATCVLVLATALILGLATPLSALLLTILLSPIIDTYLGNPGIGSLVTSMIALSFAIMPAGTTLSIDNYLLRNRYGAPIRLLYQLWGGPSIQRAQVARLLPLLAYAAISAFSALQHIHEPEWQSGETVGLLLLLPLMNPSSYELFGYFAQVAPRVYHWLSIVASYGMLSWQILMIPLMLINRYTRVLCIVWGIPFFVASAQLLNIKMLGVFEYVLWILVFLNIPKRMAKESVIVFFDDRCNLCDRTVRTISFLDLFRTIDFAPLSRNIERMSVHKVTEEEARTDLVGVLRGTAVLRGYQLYVGLSTRVFLLLPLWPILKLGEISGIGAAIYRFIADRRTRLFGVCEIPKYRSRDRESTLPAAVAGCGVAQAIAIAFTILLTCFVVRIPSMVGWNEPGLPARFVDRVFGPAPLVFGLSKIDVFNKYDLNIYRHYVRLSVKGDDGKLSPAVLYPKNEMTDSVLTTAHRVISRQPIYCGSLLMTETLRLLPLDHPYRAKTLHADFYAIAVPNARDAKRPGDQGMLRIICQIEGHLDASGAPQVHTTLSALGEQLIKESFLNDRRVDGAWLDSVQSFPCAAESDRLSFWVDHVNKIPLSESELSAVRELLTVSRASGPMACLRSFATLLPEIPDYHVSDAFAQDSQACNMDSSIAKTIVDAPSRNGRHVAEIVAARNAIAAAQRNDLRECVKQSEAVRRAYFDEVDLTGKFITPRDPT